MLRSRFSAWRRWSLPARRGALSVPAGPGRSGGAFCGRGSRRRSPGTGEWRRSRPANAPGGVERVTRRFPPSRPLAGTRQCCGGNGRAARGTPGRGSSGRGGAWPGPSPGPPLPPRPAARREGPAAPWSRLSSRG